MKEVIHTENAPEAIGPYSQAIKTGNMIFTAGQIGINPDTGEMNNSTLQDEVHQIMSNLRAVLKAAGAGLEDVVKTTIFMADLSLFNEVNKIYGTYFENDPPARSTVEVARLPKDVRLEIDMIASI